MILSNTIAHEIAQQLLEIKAVVLNVEQPFTWASGIKSPIYCDNRKTLSYPQTRNFIKQSFAEIIADKFKNAEVVAGVATAGIPHGALVADALNLPFVYVRDKAKGHGLENQIEGKLEKGQRVIVIEDLISTGGSSLKAVEALRNAGAEVIGLGAIFTYGFAKAEEAFNAKNCPFFTLSDYSYLSEKALEHNYIKEEDFQTLKEWRESPESWRSE